MSDLSLERYYVTSRQGPYLKVNEDFAEVDLENLFFSLYDGFGGTGIGDKGVSFLRDQINNFFLRVTEDKDATMPFFYNFNYSVELNALVNAVTSGHRLVLKRNNEGKAEERFGASGAFVVQSNEQLSMLLTGSVFAYLVRSGELHTLYEADLSLKNFSSSGASYYCSNIPYSAFGLYYHLDYEVREIALEKGDQVIISTDGALNRLSQTEILSCFVSDKKSKLKTCAENLFNKNNGKGNRDNQSVIILDY